MKLKILNTVFKAIQKEKYVIVKSFNINEYKEGSDIDIFCYSINELKNKVIKSLNNIISDYKMNIDIKSYKNHCHLDIVFEGNVFIRFDLFDSLPSYKKLILRESLFDIILEKRVLFNNGDLEYYVCDENFNNLIRYIEYIEYFSPENNKIKHLEYLEKNLKRDNEFYNNIHHYVKFKFEKVGNKRNFSLNDLNELIIKVRQTKMIDLPKKIFKYLFK